jgi:hypothetical protein
MRIIPTGVYLILPEEVEKIFLEDTIEITDEEWDEIETAYYDYESPEAPPWEFPDRFPTFSQWLKLLIELKKAGK